MLCTCTTVLGAGRIVMIPVGCRVCGMALLDDMHRILKEFTHSGDERPDQQRRDSDGCDAFHSCPI